MDVTIVIHCRDVGSRLHASEDCLTILTDELPEATRVTQKLHRHCFDGGLTEMEEWLKAFPSCRFGFTAILLNRDRRHSQLTRVVEKLPLQQILLETDAPHLSPPGTQQRFNSCYTAVAIAKEIARIKGITCKEVLRQTKRNAVDLYQLK
jgi:Tat protein secretion system quality control protein TatD with DNase activity